MYSTKSSPEYSYNCGSNNTVMPPDSIPEKAKESDYNKDRSYYFADDSQDTTKFLVYGATVGIVDFKQVARDAFGGNSDNIGKSMILTDQSAKVAPTLINNFINYYDPTLFFTDGEFNKPIEPPRGRSHNIFMFDNVCKFNISTIIIAANRNITSPTSDLKRVWPTELNIPTTNDDQCKLISGGCYPEELQYDANTCEKRGTRCYSTTGSQCQSNLDCSTISGGCKNTSGSAYYCKYQGTSCQCNNPNLQTCSNDNHCVWEKKAQKCSGIAGYNDNKCKRKGLTDKCECKL